ncbi:hypothetical protein [Variovorax sp. OV329]|uniref:hypothetical protein n=1 Tax=Variovorax sp. OV329 TaxID=1882825 RepID=UPI0008E1B6FD|nr:hypothetical protein [Variovorax sp. OV329]SFM05026.1 hypothetical protein SAMN05444747_102170 [Variovorax sp. OV329]
MQSRPAFFLAAAAVAATLAWPALQASAQTTPPPAVVQCDGVQQDKAACQREAGAAKQEAARGGLTSPAPSSQEANAMARCQSLAGADKADCEARMRGAGSSSSSGSVMGGGVIRETVTPVPAPSPAK